MIPRAIALITTLSSESLSFFDIPIHASAIMAVGIENKRDGQPNDTAANILATGEFTVHISDHVLVDQMKICPIKFAADSLKPGDGEFIQVRSPRILRAPAAFECHLVQTVPVAPARVIVLTEVKRMFVRETLVDPKTLYVDQAAVGRLGGHLYAR